MAVSSVRASAFGAFATPVRCQGHAAPPSSRFIRPYARRPPCYQPALSSSALASPPEAPTEWTDQAQESPPRAQNAGRPALIDPFAVGLFAVLPLAAPAAALGNLDIQKAPRPAAAPAHEAGEVVSCSKGVRRHQPPWGDLGRAAQISNLLYRRFPIGRSTVFPVRSNLPAACKLETCDPADWKSALRRQRQPVAAPGA